jgi:hypothetical protein
MDYTIGYMLQHISSNWHTIFVVNDYKRIVQAYPVNKSHYWMIFSKNDIPVFYDRLEDDRIFI